MEVDAILAGWVAAYLAGRMERPGLVSAFGDLLDQVPDSHSHWRGSVAALIDEVRAAPAEPEGERRHVVAAVSRALGRPPKDYLGDAPAAVWFGCGPGIVGQRAGSA